MTKLFIYSLLSIFVLACVDAVSKRQYMSCSDSDYPVCATDGTHWFLFKNECRLNTENIYRGQSNVPKLEKTEIANCFKRCDQVCTDEYAPLCARTATAQRTFQNRCQLDLENCKNGNIWMILHEGECPPTPLPPPIPCDPECPTFCPLEYNPVCASFGDIDQTFQNMCYLKADICTSKRAWQIKYESDCMDSQPECNEACPEIYSPICATFNGENMTFSNECLLDAENCLTGNQWSFLHVGECANPGPNCTTICPEIYEPVCGSNNGELRTFPNSCFMNVESCHTGQEWNIEYPGECREPPQQCSEVCPFDFLPICATADGVTRTFVNQCFLDSEACRTGENWVVINRGACESPTTPQPIPPDTLPPTISPTTIASPTIPPPTIGIPSQTIPPPAIPQPTIPPPTIPPPTIPPQIISPSITPQPIISPPTNCPDACPALYVPICAVFQGNQRTFTNGCDLSAEVCRTGLNWQILYDGPCDEEVSVSIEPPIPSICPEMYDPICATFNGELRTFSSQCLMDTENADNDQVWQIVSPGECPPITTTIATPRRRCPRCSDLHRPICGFSNGEQKTFTNECQLMGENCFSNRNWQLLYDGPCDDEISVTNPSIPDICPVIFHPICAAFKGELRTFPNQCIMDAEIYNTNDAWQIVSPGECPPTTTIVPTGPCPKCSNLYQPVCGFSNGEQRTFTNECQLMGENCYSSRKWVLAYEGECRNSDLQRNGHNISPLNYDPTYATFNGDRETFPNDGTNFHWVIVQPEPCPEQTGVVPPADSQLISRFRLRSSTENLNPTSLHQVLAPPLETSPLIDPIPPPLPVDYQINECVDVYDPVCAVYNEELRTFVNTCFLEINNCRSNENWQIVNYGPCRPLSQGYGLTGTDQ